MANLTNSNKDLITGVVKLLRAEVSGWSTNSEHNVSNVWGTQVPQSANDEFPRAAVDIIGGSDFDLSVELDVKLREVTLKVVVFGENAGDVEDLMDSTEDEIGDHWASYVGDWSFREVDGFTELAEEREVENMLRYNRSRNFIFETVKEV